MGYSSLGAPMYTWATSIFMNFCFSPGLRPVSFTGSQLENLRLVEGNISSSLKTVMLAQRDLKSQVKISNDSIHHYLSPWFWKIVIVKKSLKLFLFQSLFYSGKWLMEKNHPSSYDSGKNCSSCSLITPLRLQMFACEKTKHRSTPFYF